MIESILTLEELNSLDRPEGSLVFCEEDNKNYRFTEGGWIEEDPKVSGNIEMSLYEINKQLVSQLPDFGEEQWAGAEKVFDEWYGENKDFKYFLLYGREISYFTLFHKAEKSAEFDTIYASLYECLEPFTVKAFDKTEDGVIEIWIMYEDEATCMYLFPYDNGVVTYAE